jgi:hypothetical protein
MVKHTLLRPVLVVCTVILCLTLYLSAALQQATLVNTNLADVDQSAYMAFARKAYESHYAYSNDGARMPLYPFLQSLFLRPEMSDEEFFQQGKLLNIALSLALLAVLALIAWRFLAPLHALAFVLIAAFTVIVFKAGYFQAEVLYYFLTFFVYLLFWRLLREPRIWLAILAGIVAGITQLTKAALLPALAVFIVFAIANWLWIRRRSREPSEAKPSGRATSALLIIPLVAVFFLATVFPYERENKRIFGRYFYNVNSTFYVWYDDWEQAKAGTRAHGDRVGWPQMPAEEIPSMAKYLREHTPTQMLNRVVSGALRIWRDGTDEAPGYLRYLLVFAGLFLAAAVWQRARLRQYLAQYPLVCLFPLAYFGLTLLLAFWQEPIVRGNRLVLAQFLPLMFTLALGLQVLLRSATLRIGRPVGALKVVDALILTMVVADIYMAVTVWAGNFYGGS